MDGAGGGGASSPDGGASGGGGASSVGGVVALERIADTGPENVDSFTVPVPCPTVSEPNSLTRGPDIVDSSIRASRSDGSTAFTAPLWLDPSSRPPDASGPVTATGPLTEVSSTEDMGAVVTSVTGPLTLPARTCGIAPFRVTEPLTTVASSDRGVPATAMEPDTDSIFRTPVTFATSTDADTAVTSSVASPGTSTVRWTQVSFPFRRVGSIRPGRASSRSGASSVPTTWTPSPSRPTILRSPQITSISTECPGASIVCS